jgi:DNA-binding LytR/AlgR family response regulator
VGIKGFFIFSGFTISIAIIPIIGVIVISHNTMLRRNLRASTQLSQMIMDKKGPAVTNDNKLVITSENKNQKIEIPASNLICIESEGNYVNTWFLEGGKIVRLLIRNTIKNIGTQILEAENLFKCHRAYIINLSYIEKVTGNSQGYRLLIKYLDKEVPVARNYSKSFREAISKSP